MTRLLLPLLALALAVPASAQVDSSTPILAGVEAHITFETLTMPDGPSQANVVVSGLDAATPIPTSLMFSTRARPGRMGTLPLTRASDGTYTGSGRLPAPADVRSVTFNFEEIKVTFRTPGGIETGESDVNARFKSGSAPATSAKVKVRFSCCPAKVVVKF